ncbi:MAG: hypothetical protein WBA74_15980 [Cyclobacteriaceae bacterium]
MKPQKIHVFKIIFGVLCLFLVITLLLWSLWNWLIPDIFGLKRLSFLEAGGLLLLSKILFGGFNKEHLRKKMSSGYWESKFVSRKDGDLPLTSEQKSILKDKFINKWCSHEKSEKKDMQA